jgi:hypothetical protein
LGGGCNDDYDKNKTGKENGMINQEWTVAVSAETETEP